jgi:GNAT superfamily N-acetyltransferase
MSVEMGARRSSQSASTPTGSLVSARFATDPSRKDQVEIALAVVDEWQFQGVGSSLIDHLIEFASRRLHPVGGLAWSRDTEGCDRATRWRARWARRFTALPHVWTSCHTRLLFRERS